MKPSSPKLKSPVAAGAPPSDPPQVDSQSSEHSDRSQTPADRSQTLASLDLSVPAELPIAAHADELIKAIRDFPVLIVCGETGSGKSTQLPKLCLAAGVVNQGILGHTQPRRLAARNVAERLAQEVRSPLGQAVGSQVRFGDQTGPQTVIKLMTDGILLAELQSDRWLRRYDVIIIDEAHERSLNIDFLIGSLKRIRQQRPDLKIILTSATIDADRFAEHFAEDDVSVPIFQVEGRGFPVETIYLPAEEVAESESLRHVDLSRHVIEGITQAGRRTQGDVLVFLPTERDIREVSHRVQKHFQSRGIGDRVDVLPLYARLPQSQQQAIFAPKGSKRRLIFATNVAESSVTVPRIMAVVDSGLARISRFSPRSRMQRLPIEAVSRASADQRAGRCGRIAPGVCVRLYGVDDYESRDAFTTPEIRRTNLASVVLRLKSMGVDDVESFPFLDPPRPEAIREATKTLFELSALDDGGDLTDLGRRMARLPVDPRIARMLIEAEATGCLPAVLVIAAGVEVPDPRLRPVDSRDAADQLHREFADSNSDFLGLLRLWRFYEQLREEYSRSKTQRLLQKRFLSPTRFREWSDVYRQLRDAMKSKPRHAGSPRPSEKRRLGSVPYLDSDESEFILSKADSESVHRALLVGLLPGVARLDEKKVYVGGGGTKLKLWPGSDLFAAPPKWIMAAETVETSQVFARMVARIQPAWIESAAPHLLKKSHVDPHWSEKSNGAFCFENQSLFGLPIVVRRKVPLAPIDPQSARDLLINEGLAESKLRTRARFVRHNEQLCESLAALAAKTRDRGYVVDPLRVAHFYHARIPSDVVDVARLEKLDRDRDSASVESLYANSDDFVDAGDNEIAKQAYPDHLEVGQTKLPLTYRFEPGGDADGIEVRVHRDAMPQISQARLDWMVPGRLPDKITAMIKSLPKRIRRELAPAAETAQKIADELLQDYSRLPFEEALCQAISRHAEQAVGMDDFRLEKIDAHHRMLVSVVDDAGQTLAQGRHLAPLAKRFALGDADVDAADTAPDENDEPWQRKYVDTFDIDMLPRQVTRIRGGVEIAQFPGFRIRDGKISTKVFPDLTRAELSIRDASTRLFAAKMRRDLLAQVRHLPGLPEAKLKVGGYFHGDVDGALMQLLARIAMVDGEKPVRTADEFDRRVSEKPLRIAEATVKLSRWLVDFTEAAFNARRECEAIKRTTRANVIADLTQQQSHLIFDAWLARVPWAWLSHYPRYFSAIAYRCDKIRSGSAKHDSDSMAVVADLWKRWIATLPETLRGAGDIAESETRWMFEELRVSLFAQPLGTSMRISPTRLEKRLGN
ncbi:MAG: ATP-dependent RNA helicase HrpA [Planctomycetota bacterium]